METISGYWSDVRETTEWSEERLTEVLTILKDFEAKEGKQQIPLNLPQDLDIEKYRFKFNNELKAKHVIHHWQELIARKDFYYFSERQCYQNLVELYLFYIFILDRQDAETALYVAMDCWEKALTSSPLTTPLREDTNLRPWVTKKGHIHAYVHVADSSLSSQFVMLWAWYSDILEGTFCEEKKNPLARKAWEIALRCDRILFSDTHHYALKCYYYKPDELVQEALSILKPTVDVDLLTFAKRMLRQKPYLRLEEFIQMIRL